MAPLIDAALIRTEFHIGSPEVRIAWRQHYMSFNTLAGWENALSARGRIVVLNGVSSVGKSSIARALQMIATQPFLHVQMDTFLQMLPPAYQRNCEEFCAETHAEGEKRTLVANSGMVVKRTLRGMRHAIAAMAGQGLSLVVDAVMDETAAAEYAQLLAAFSTCMVGVFAPLDVVETREQDRGDRVTGLARAQFDLVHRNIHYDLMIDTSMASPMECALQIKQKWKL
jgi:chloramphenicol 3-O phosphotransferase